MTEPTRRPLEDSDRIKPGDAYLLYLDGQYANLTIVPPCTPYCWVGVVCDDDTLESYAEPEFRNRMRSEKVQGLIPFIVLRRLNGCHLSVQDDL